VGDAWRSEAEIFDPTGRLVVGNDDWNARGELSAATDRVRAFKLATGSRDAALLTTIAPGGVTAQATSVAGS